MTDGTSLACRFQKFREQAGLTKDQAADQMGISLACLWDLETHDDEISCCYSPSEVRAFCRVLGIVPNELFGVDNAGPAVSAPELVELIHQECRWRGVTLEQFEDVVGWRLSACIDPPDKLLEDMTIDGLQWLCRELRIDWHRAI